MPGPAGLNYSVCSQAIVDALITDPSTPADMKAQIKALWDTILNTLFTHIINNIKITVTIPQIPSENLVLTIAGNVTISEVQYPITITSNSIAAATIPANSVAVL
jgi:hypothetical protein